VQVLAGKSAGRCGQLAADGTSSPHLYLCIYAFVRHAVSSHFGPWNEGALAEIVQTTLNLCAMRTTANRLVVVPTGTAHNHDRRKTLQASALAKDCQSRIRKPRDRCSLDSLRRYAKSFAEVIGASSGWENSQQAR
jgi:hypothetical protein